MCIHPGEQNLVENLLYKETIDISACTSFQNLPGFNTARSVNPTQLLGAKFFFQLKTSGCKVQNQPEVDTILLILFGGPILRMLTPFKWEFVLYVALMC